MTSPYFAELQRTHTHPVHAFLIQSHLHNPDNGGSISAATTGYPPFPIGFMLAGCWLMGFVDSFNHAGADVMEVMLDELLLIAYLALHRVMPILPTVKAAHRY